jgi:hypothetical protein
MYLPRTCIIWGKSFFFMNLQTEVVRENALSYQSMQNTLVHGHAVKKGSTQGWKAERL